MGEEEKGYLACLRCGKIMPAEASFCNSCGADLKQEPLPGVRGAVEPSDFKPAAAIPAPNVQGRPMPLMAAGPGQRPLPQPPFQQPYRALPRRRRTDGFALASLICALASFMFLPVIPALAAIVLGFVARERIRGKREELEGEGLALAGILVGLSNLALTAAVLAAVLFVAFSG